MLLTVEVGSTVGGLNYFHWSYAVRRGVFRWRHRARWCHHRARWCHRARNYIQLSQHVFHLLKHFLHVRPLLAVYMPATIHESLYLIVVCGRNAAAHEKSRIRRTPQLLTNRKTASNPLMCQNLERPAQGGRVMRHVARLTDAGGRYSVLSTFNLPRRHSLGGRSPPTSPRAG